MLYDLTQLKHEDLEICCLVRDAKKGDVVKQAYPDLKIVHGSLDDIDLIRSQAESADVVLRKSRLISDLESV